MALIDNQCVGYILASEILGEVEIEDICVSKAYRRQGIADALIESLIALCHNMQAQYILLEVAQQNSQARALYEKHGFSLVRVRKAYYQLANNTFDDALLLTKIVS